MIKKTFASVAAAGLLATQSAAVAAAAPAGLDSADRIASPVGQSEDIAAAGLSEAWLVILFALVAAGILVLIESEEGDRFELPASP